MNRANSPFVNVDELMAWATVEQVSAYYGVPLPDLKRVGDETRTRCFLLCGKAAETGDRALAIQETHPARQWKCHAYGCGKSGNLVSLCDLMKPGPNMGGRPRGDRFKAIAADLRAMVAGLPPPEAPAPPAIEKPVATPAFNVPLKDSSNERARGLVELDRKFIVDPASMPPAASAYFRKRAFLTPDVCRNWRMGYLPRDVGGDDKSGGTMRGKIVSPVQNEAGDVLTWFGRDPEFESKLAQWMASGKVGREPEKFHFVKGFQRGSESFGQHRLAMPDVQTRLSELGFLTIVEGTNDVIRLATLGIPAVGLLSNSITDAQVRKIAAWAQAYCNRNVLLLLDNDAAGETGAKHALWELAQHCRVQLGWSRETHGGQFRDRQPETLTAEEWAEITVRKI